LNPRAAEPIPSTTATTTYHRTEIDGIGVFYREAGPKDAPTIVLLHGFPSSSRQFGMLIPLLATRYHLIAPDYPGFGQSEATPPSLYSYTFDHLAETIGRLLAELKIGAYALYIHDYGAPVGMRMILAHPDRLRALISQNEVARHCAWTSAASRRALDADCRFHLAGELVVADGPCLPRGQLKILAQRLLQGPQQRLPHGFVVGELDPIVDVTDRQFVYRRLNNAQRRQIVDDHFKHRHQLDALNSHVVVEQRPETRVGRE